MLLAGLDGGVELDVLRLGARDRYLVVDAAQLVVWKGAETDLNPLGLAARSLVGAAEAEPGADVARGDVRSPQRIDDRADSMCLRGALHAGVGICGRAACVRLRATAVGHRRRDERQGERHKNRKRASNQEDLRTAD